MPYWDYTTERMSSLRAADDPSLILDEFVGGEGNPDDSYTVNEYSWSVTREEWWVPAGCTAEDDVFPICSLKREIDTEDMLTIPDAEQSGRAITELSDFMDFARWYFEDWDGPYGNADYGGNLGSVHQDLSIMTTAYDPIWLLFHSFVQYQQFMWTDCNDYDLIDPADLDEHPEAYSAFCDSDDACSSSGLLDEAFTYPLAALKDAAWSFIHSEPLTVRKAYHAPRWNILYDLGAGDGFFKNAGIDEWCRGKLNPEWFRLDEAEHKKESELSALPQRLHMIDEKGTWLPLGSAAAAAVVLLLLALVQSWRKHQKSHTYYLPI